ncbi:MAG TPA: non-homologous end-joining DNA ligase [Acidimicrobiales bacterium]|nr:non-homologous end-joining DNA ligase [Acidimicrobiales bacterium]
MPDIPLPMKATADELPTGDGWVYEVKWDGMRAIVAVDHGEVRLQTANGKDATASFPELDGLGEALGVTSAVLDGEIVAFDARGRPDFGRLQQRMHVGDRRAAAARAEVVPCVLMLFDLLALDGRSVVDLPWSERRRLLEALVEPGPHWQVPAVYDDGRALFDAAEANDLEGIIAKRADSTYRPGSRTREWRKVKVRRRQEFVVGGWAPGKGGRTGRIGGLLVGYHDAPGGTLRYAGRVGSGLTEAELGTLDLLFADLVSPGCPFEPPPPRAHAAGATWLRPEVVVEVAYAEWTSDGRLRHPTYCGRRIDKDADAVTAEP